ncbi:uncharacterized protein LOC128731831 [Anopheles nili]|uniref:uncharacterized protein LOC128731831 n=1 Tax=Anopheles nili TaxID=185578 RepID=UPI00237AD1CF|nr:uncharacterized protein LOC128731831 [Anopheles nili]
MVLLLSAGNQPLPVVCLLVVCLMPGFDHSGPSASALLLPEYDYASDIHQHDIERDLLPSFDGRSYFLPVPEAPDDEDELFRSDFNLATFRPISPTPGFTLDPSYISPADVLPARAKRANRQDRRRSAKQRKREQHKEPLADERDADEDDDEDDYGDGEQAAKDAPEHDRSDVEDYAERYERFIAKHFDDLASERKKSAPQRKAPKAKSTGKDADDGAEEDGDYKFDRFDYGSSEDYERIKAESEEQSRRLAKDPRNCRTYEKDGMVCSVCHDPASDSASESCAYATEPHHRKYAFVKERNYDSKQDDPNRQASGPSPADSADEDEQDQDGETRAERQTDGEVPSVGRRVPPLPLRKPALRTKPHQSATNGGGYRYQPQDLRSNRASMKLRAAEPDATKDANIYVMDYEDQDEVAKVLAEFRTRDWSNCRKGKRMADDELTCYQCKDAAGVNHEECMYVSESRQVASSIVQAPPALRKRKRVVPLSRRELAALEPLASSTGGPAKESQTVKRTVSFRSFVSESGRDRASVPLDGSDASERVIHYEHHISHEVP